MQDYNTEEMLATVGRCLFAHQPVPYHIIQWWEERRELDAARGKSWPEPPPTIILPGK